MSFSIKFSFKFQVVDWWVVVAVGGGGVRWSAGLIWEKVAQECRAKSPKKII